MMRIYSFVELQLINFILWSFGCNNIPIYDGFSVPEAALNLAFNKGFVNNTVILSERDEKILEKLFG